MRKLGVFKSLIMIAIMGISSAAQSQIIISLLLGDALNTEKIEFGIAGGMSRSNIYSLSTAKPLNSFDLGFYFHIRIKNNSFLSTGVHVKSNVGATGMPTYSVGDVNIDDVFKDGTLTKKIPTFYVPILYHHRIYKRFYLEAGPMLGLNYKQTDIFKVSNDLGDLEYTRKVVDEYKRIDAGLMGGAGVKFSKSLKSMSVGISYYYGLVNISKNPNQKIMNNSLYLFMRIPIGISALEEAK